MKKVIFSSVHIVKLVTNVSPILILILLEKMIHTLTVLYLENLDINKSYKKPVASLLITY